MGAGRGAFEQDGWLGPPSGQGDPGARRAFRARAAESQRLCDVGDREISGGSGLMTGEIPLRHHLRPKKFWNDMIPLQLPTVQGFQAWFLSVAECCPSTVGVWVGVGQARA